MLFWNGERWSFHCEATSHTGGNTRACSTNKDYDNNNNNYDENRNPKEHHRECSEYITEHIKEIEQSIISLGGVFHILSNAKNLLLFAERFEQKKHLQTAFGTYKRFTRVLAPIELVGG
jgi:hypothetical protein